MVQFSNKTTPKLNKSNPTEMLRYQNRAKVLDCIRHHGPTSHTAIASHTGMSSSTVSTITSELEEELILCREEGASSSGRGRPRVQLGLNPDCAYIATVRITGQALEFSLVDYAGTLKDRFNLPRNTEDKKVATLAVAVKESLLKLAARAEVAAEKIHAISITTKGLVAENRAVLLWSAVLGEQQIDFQSLLQTDWHAAVLLSNETCFSAHSVAEGAQKKTVTPLSRRQLVLSIEDSVGVGIATRETNGRLKAFAPPFGHIVHQLDGPLCRCGSHGCVEAFAGFYGILRAAFDVPADTIPAAFIPHEEMGKLAARARQGDRQSAYAFRVAGETLGAEISRLQSIFGLMPITITGSGAAFFDLMQSGFIKHLQTNLLVRFDKLPDISFVLDEAELIFNGNASVTLRNLDENLIATRQLSTGLKLA